MNANVDNAIVGLKDTVCTLQEQVDAMQNQLAVRDERPTNHLYQVNVQVYMDTRKLVIWHEGGREHQMFISDGSIRTMEDGHQYVALTSCKFEAARGSADVADPKRPLDKLFYIFVESPINTFYSLLKRGDEDIWAGHLSLPTDPPWRRYAPY